MTDIDYLQYLIHHTSRKMKQHKTNIILIGMPGSGKSTVGVILAKMLAKSYLDTDILIQNQQKRTLQDIVNSDGHMVLRAIEEQVLLGISCRDHVIATGGSAIYSEPAMNHLRKHGVIVFLHADLPTLQTRVGNYETRGIAKRPDQSFEDLFKERLVLYQKHTDATVISSNHTQEEACMVIIEWMSKHHPQCKTLSR
jgi:shikimate kinase